MEKNIKLVDLLLQIALTILVLIFWMMGSDFSFYFLVSLMIIQAISIIYNCIKNRKESLNNWRAIHYYGTTLVMIILYLIFIPVFFEWDIDTINIMLLLVILFCSGLLGIFYIALSISEYKDFENKDSE
jgi:uncharacterized membrane protein HdeD (DUF308 family)